MRSFKFTDDTSNKFWRIKLSVKKFTVHYGRIGTDGQKLTKEFPSAAAARKEHDRLVAEKLRKGYVEVTAPAAPPPVTAPDPLRASLEQALVENPDDLASHMAYADYLTEQGDPLGELIRLQLALEDESTPDDQRKKLQQQGGRLFRRHNREWLGDLAGLLENTAIKYTFRRGWLDRLKAHGVTVGLARTLAHSPALRLLRELHLEYTAFEEEGEFDRGKDVPRGANYPQLYPLQRCPYLGNVRSFTLGEVPSKQDEAWADDEGLNCSTEGEAAAGVVKRMPKLESLRLYAHDVDAEEVFSLPTLTNLRELVVYHNRSYPLEKLAKNPALRKLTHLRFHPHALDDVDPYIREPGVRALVNSPNLPALTHLQIRLSDMGDAGVRAIIASGILKRLKVLDLQHGRVSDEGARALACCPDVKHLDLLDLTNNALTSAGVRALKGAGVKVVAKSQWLFREGDSEGDGTEDYLYAGDIE